MTIGRTLDPSDATHRIGMALGPVQRDVKRFALSAGLTAAGVVIVYTVMLAFEVNRESYGGEAIQIDFAAFWAAAKLALAGRAIEAFDPVALSVAQSLPPVATNTDLRWLYPPAWLLAVMPLGLLPFTEAFLLYGAVSLAAFAAATRRVAAPMAGGAMLMLAAPAVVFSLMLCNINLLWNAGLVGALAALAAGRPALAGCLIGLLTVKPQLGLLIPVALMAGGHWRAIVWAIGVSILVAAIPTAIFGFAYWAAFLSAMESMWQYLGTDIIRFDWLITWYATARLAGFGHDIAIALQWGVTIFTAIIVLVIWRRPVTSDLKAAALCVGILLATPYAYHYEMTLGLAAALFLLRDGFGASRWARLWLLALWLGPLPGVTTPVTPAMYAPVLLSATLGLCFWRSRQRPRTR